MEKSQKATEDNTEMLQNLLIGIENMGDNLKQFREEMEGWKTTKLQNAEREFEEAEQEMLTEVSLSVPEISEPVNVSSCSFWYKTLIS